MNVSNKITHRLASSSRAQFYIRFAIAAVLSSVGGAALAQGLDCNQLLGQINAMDRASAQSSPYAAAIQKQRADLARTQSYAHSIGCDRKQFLFFGSPPPPQCSQLNARIGQMRGNLAQLQANASRSTNSPERQALVARYDTYCRQQRQRGFFESLFGGGNPNPAPTGMPPDGVPPPAQAPQTPAGGAEALCVRTCDGGFFPLVLSARRTSPEMLTDLCKASCPNTEVKVYTRVPGAEVRTAVGLDGTPYMSLPAALKFQKSYDPACTCKPAGQSWAQALANAERVLGHERKGDIIVTPEKSAEMSRPKLTSAQRSKLLGATSAKAAAAAAKSGDDLAAHDAADAAQVPTASDDSAGIATDEVKQGASYSEGQGKSVEVTGPDGAKHQVRIVGPQP
ncbi:MAG: DUF2865 domain-containing protein [Beijerinckiaceae bacterium]|nr:MAG: DUF2865 domain-containing protein [Beijerinckiaceae bacterium]